MTTALKKTILLFIVILTIVVSTFAASVWFHEDSLQRVEFSLTDQDKNKISNKHLAGRHLIVFFGYTSCPDICPTQLYKLDQAIRALDEQGKSNGLSPVFISIDPERDSHEKLKAYLSYAHSSFIALTGSRAQLKVTTDSFHTLLQGAPEPGDQDYLVAHSSLFYVVDEFGRIIDHIPFNAQVNDIVEKIKSLL